MVAVAMRAAGGNGNHYTVRRSPVKNDVISLRRRHLMIAGLAGLAAPAGVFAASTAQGGLEITTQPLVVSGRVVDTAGKPLAGAIVAASRVSTTTDADGRFVFTTVASSTRNGLPQSLPCSVSHPGHRTLENKIEFGRASLQRDEAGKWRTAVHLHLA